MDVAQHIEAIEQEGRLFADAARRSGLDTEVPSCPGWDVRDLVRHLGMIHLWAAAHVAYPHDDPGYESEEDEHAAFAAYWPTLGVFWPEDGDLIDWYLRTNANLIDSLESASPTVEAWTFLPAPSPLAMWARRQAHEIGVHRFDAEHASNAETGFEPDFAADGIDEMLAGFAPHKESLPVSGMTSMSVHATDTGARWHVTMSPDGIRTSRGEEAADVTLTGTASDLYLAVWNRGDDSNIGIEGDRDILDVWHGNVRVRWS
ncbi:MAG: maleylpyruvate isomerase family mycothiol-dependent enzyme [Acidimicrobiia bacterium]|nr:maleylpyruvate isomerase family mycothiol-dependent enzyme [Acidimicrobiia bacterium]